jgi:uncharacterized protein YbjT (DUF2867 family)
MAAGRLDALTGAFGFTGRAIAERLLADGREIVTLSRHGSASCRIRSCVTAPRSSGYTPAAPRAACPRRATLDPGQGRREPEIHGPRG